MLTTPLVLKQTGRALPMQLRRLQARIRLGQATQETEAESRELLAVAEQLGGTAEIVQTRSLLVQSLTRAGMLDEAIRIARESLQLAESVGDDALAGEAMHRLAITLLASHPADAVELLLRLTAQAHARGDRAMEARAFLTLGVARTRTRNDLGGMEAFRAALALARDAQALDLAASASMNLGVLELRGGDFEAAHQACTDALRLYTTLRNNTNRLVALYNLANLERERGDAEAALSLYRETAALAEQLGTADVAIGARAGIGLSALRLREMEEARDSLQEAKRQLGSREDWWFQGRELFESLVIRMAALDGEADVARRRFRDAVERLEPTNVYAAAWLVADCASELATLDADVWTAVDRLANHSAIQAFTPLSARFTALQDLVDRPLPAYDVTARTVSVTLS